MNLIEKATTPRGVLFLASLALAYIYAHTVSPVILSVYVPVYPILAALIVLPAERIYQWWAARRRVPEAYSAEELDRLDFDEKP